MLFAYLNDFWAINVTINSGNNYNFTLGGKRRDGWAIFSRNRSAHMLNFCGCILHAEINFIVSPFKVL